jgi:hypothetical protein
MSVKFKCLASGNIFEFVNAHDIKTMRQHPEYEEIQAVVVEEPPKKAGRPRKDTIEGEQDAS